MHAFDYISEEEAIFTKNLPNIEACESESVKLVCEVSKASADVSWFKGDYELPDGGRYEHIAESRKRILIINNIRLEDAGEYNCRLPNSRTTGKLGIKGKRNHGTVQDTQYQSFSNVN